MLSLAFSAIFIAVVQAHYDPHDTHDYPVTKNGERCTIPFYYHGVKYNGCTTVNDGKPWCATGPEKYVVGSGKWAYCCPDIYSSCSLDCSRLGGYKKNGRCAECKCAHEDLCKVGNPCGSANCRVDDGPGGPSAHCSCGYNELFNTKTKKCETKNPCLTSSNPCGKAKCNFSGGKAECACPSNERFDSATKACVVINPCLTSSNPCGKAKCNFSDGKAVCACPSNERFDSATKACVVIDPCKANTNPCGSATCTSQDGKAVCSCSGTNKAYNAATKQCVAACPSTKYAYSGGYCYGFIGASSYSGAAAGCRAHGYEFPVLTAGSPALKAVAAVAWSIWPVGYGAIRIAQTANGRCATINGNTRYTQIFYNYPCSQGIVYVCKFKWTPSPCPEGQAYSDGYCYSFVGASSYNGAAGACRAHGYEFPTFQANSPALKAVAAAAWRKWPVGYGAIRIAETSGGRCATINGNTHYTQIAWNFPCSQNIVYVCRYKAH